MGFHDLFNSMLLYHIILCNTDKMNIIEGRAYNGIKVPQSVVEET